MNIKNWYDKEWYDKEWYDRNWYDINWYNKETWTLYNKEWYDQYLSYIYWYNKEWYNRKWYHKDTGTLYNKEWYDEEWYNKEWYDEEWYNKEWYNKEWYHKDTGTLYNIEWFDRNWYNKIDSKIILDFKNKNFDFSNYNNLLFISDKCWKYLLNIWLLEIILNNISDIYSNYELKYILQKIINNLDPVNHYDLIRKFFENKWMNIDNLDDEKLSIIIDTHKSKLVKARAWSWKTTLLTIYIQFLIKILWINQDKILAFSFNRWAAKELQQRVVNSGVNNFTSSMTFHSFAFRIVNATLWQNKELILDKDKNTPEEMLQSQFIQDIVRNIISNEKETLDKLYNYFREEVRDLEKYLITITKNEYYKKIRKEEYLKENKQITLDWKYVKSIWEKWISDFLFEHGISYGYEWSVWKPKQKWFKATYNPDFYLKNIEIEEVKKWFFTWLEEKNEKSFIIEFWWFPDDIEYKKQIEWKRKYIKEKLEKISLIEFFQDELDYKNRKWFEKIIKEKLEKNWIKCKKIDKEILIKKVREKHIADFTKLLTQFIWKAKLNEYSIDDLRRKLENIKGNLIEKDKLSIFFDFAFKVYEEYEKKLQIENKEDFHDKLKQAIQQIDKSWWNIDFNIWLSWSTKKFISLKEIDFLLIDEYQDFSHLFSKLIDVIKKYNSNLKILAVWDDWQLINSFMGSDIRYINIFLEKYEDSKEFYLQTSYRLPEKLIDLSNNLMGWFWKWAKFWENNKKWEIKWINIIEDIDKYFKLEYNNIIDKKYFKYVDSFFWDKLISNELDKEKIEIKLKWEKEWISNYFKELYYFIELIEIFNKEKISDKSFLILYRNNEYNGVFFDKLKDKVYRFYRKQIKDKTKIKKFEEYWKKNISFSTIHKAKWLEADIVLFIWPEIMPFIHPNNFVEVIFDRNKNDFINEEKRLFYVALTRTKNNLYYLYEDVENNRINNDSDSLLELFLFEENEEEQNELRFTAEDIPF